MNLRQTTKIFVSGLFLLASATLPLAAATRPCEALRQWALENRAKLPHDFAGLSALPMGERRALYDVLTAEEKSAYWQEKVAAYLVAHPELSAAQVEAIGVAAAALRPPVFTWHEAGEKPLAKVEKEARAALGDDLVHAVFFDFAAADVRATAGGEPCHCRYDEECGMGYPYRCGGNPPCEPIIACGIGWTETCTRTCVFAP